MSFIENENQSEMLSVRALTKSFGSTDVLKGISFSIKKGEVLAIIGSSGSGKTTLLRCLNYLEVPDGGEIYVAGKEYFSTSAEALTETEIRERRLHMGLVFQSFNLFPQYTVKANLMLAAQLLENEKLKKALKSGEITKAQYREMKSAVAEEVSNRADSLLARVGLSEKAEFYPCQLSGGQQQRAAIARALALTPDILCFDEPTSALDPELTGEVLNVIRSLKGGDSTMIVVTHEMEFARHVADKVIFMADGVIAEEGNAAEVFDNPQSEALKSFLGAAKRK